MGLVFVLACGGGSADTGSILLDVPDGGLPSASLTPGVSPEATPPEPKVADVATVEVTVDDVVSEAAVEGVAMADADPNDEEEAVNKSVGTQTPTLALVPAAEPAAVGVGQIQLTSRAGIQPMVNGVPMRLTASQGFMSEVSEGKNSLEVRNLLGNVTGSAQVEVLDGRRIRYEWRRRALSLLGDVASSPMPDAVIWDQAFVTDDDVGTAVLDAKQPLQPSAAMDKK